MSTAATSITAAKRASCTAPGTNCDTQAPRYAPAMPGTPKSTTSRQLTSRLNANGIAPTRLMSVTMGSAPELFDWMESQKSCQRTPARPRGSRTKPRTTVPRKATESRADS